MSGALAVTALACAATLLGFAAAAELVRGAAGRRGGPSRPGRVSRAGREQLPAPLAELARRLDLRARLIRAGLAERVELRALLAAKCAAAIAGAGLGMVAAPAAPGRLSLLVALGLPLAGFFAPDAALERRARSRGAELRAALPDALDLLATAAAAGRSPLAGFAEVSRGEGPLARELGVVVAETSCGASQAEALSALRRRMPAPELAAMAGVIERSRRHGSPLAEQLYDQAAGLRAAQRRRIGERAARAAPKIQLAVALLLVPSVLLMIAAGLLANLDRFLAGL
ncbi:MAG: type II secretion system F family protein [Solirubrobacterales bacterium]